MKKFILFVSAVLFIADCGSGGNDGNGAQRVAELPEGVYEITKRIDRSSFGTESFNSSESISFEGRYVHGVAVFPHIPAIADVKYALKTGFVSRKYAVAENYLRIDNDTKLPVNDNTALTGVLGKYDCYKADSDYRCQSGARELHMRYLGPSVVNLPMIFAGPPFTLTNTTLVGTYAGALSSHSGKCGVANALSMRLSAGWHFYVYTADCISADSMAQFDVPEDSLSEFSRLPVSDGVHDISFTYEGITYSGRFSKVADGTF